MELLVIIVQFILGLTFIVGIHEFGHLLMAKLFKMGVERYMIGFPPKIYGFKFRGTEYAIGMLPLGGFVKISGMIDESFDSKQLQSEPQPWEYRAKPAWQRLIVIMGGIIFNILSAIAIFILLTYFVPKIYYSFNEINKHGIYASALGKEFGFRSGDKILKINGKTIKTMEDIKNLDIFLADDVKVTVIREGKEHSFTFPDGFLDKLTDDEHLISPLLPFEVEQVISDSPAEEAGLQAGDKILKIEGQTIEYFGQLSPLLQNYKGQMIEMVIERKTQNLILHPTVNIDGQLGFRPKILLKSNEQHYSFAESIPMGTYRAFEIIIIQIKGFQKIINGDISLQKSLGGPIAIARLFGSTWDIANFWRLVGILSMVIAFMNVLPIPALDGGHAIFIIFEMIAGRKPSDKFVLRAQKIGVTLLIILMVFVFGNDIYNLFI